MTTVEPPPGKSKTPTTSTAAGDWHPRTAADMLREKPEASGGDNRRKKSCHAAVGDKNMGARSTSSSASGGHPPTPAGTTAVSSGAASRSAPASRNRAGASVQATTAASPASTRRFTPDFVERPHDGDSPRLPWRGGEDPGPPPPSSSRGAKDEASHVRGWERRCRAARGGSEADHHQRGVGEEPSRCWRGREGVGGAMEGGGGGGVAALLQSASTRITTSSSAVKTPTTPPTSPPPSAINGSTTGNSTTSGGGAERTRDDGPGARPTGGLLEPKDEVVHYHPHRRSSNNKISSSGSGSSNCRTIMSGTTRWPSISSTGAASPGAGARGGGAVDQGNKEGKEESEDAGGDRASARTAGAAAADSEDGRSATEGASSPGACGRGSTAAHADAVPASVGPGMQRAKGSSAPRLQENGGGGPTVHQKSDRWTALEVIIPRLEGGLSKDMCPAVPAGGSTPYDRVPISRTGTSPTLPGNPRPPMRPASRDPHQGPPCLQQNSSGAYGREPGERSEGQPQCHARITGGGRGTPLERQSTCAGTNSAGAGTSGSASVGAGGRQVRRFSDLADGETTSAETAVVISADSSDGSVAGVSEGSSPVPVPGRDEAAAGGGTGSGSCSGAVRACVQAKSGTAEQVAVASDGISADECTVVGGVKRLGEGEGGGGDRGGSKERGVFRAPPLYERGLADSEGVQAPCERASGDTVLRSGGDEDGRGRQGGSGDGGGDGGMSAAGAGAGAVAAGTVPSARNCALPSTGGGAVKAAAALAAVPLAAKAAAAVLDGLDGRAVMLDGRPIIPGVPPGAMMDKPGQGKTECLVEVSIGLGGEYVYSFNKTGAPRRGKWSRLEEEYAKRIINDFDDGVLDAPPGVGLRQLLASKLRCEVMRVSKKFCGWACVGKRSFRPVRHPDGRASRAQASLYSLEQCWLKTFVPSSRCSSSPSNTLPPPFKASSYPSSNCTASKSLMRLVPAPPAVERDGGLASLKKQTTPAQTWLNRVRKALARDASVGAMDSLVKEGRMYCRDADVMTEEFSETPTSGDRGNAEAGRDGRPMGGAMAPESSREGQCRLMEQMHNAVRDKYGRPDGAGSVSPSDPRRVSDGGGGGGGGGGGDEPLQWWVAPRRDGQAGGDAREEEWRQQHQQQQQRHQQHQQSQEQYQQQQQQQQPHAGYRQHEEHRQQAEQQRQHEEQQRQHERQREQRGGGQGEKPGLPRQPTSLSRGAEMTRSVETRAPSPRRSPQRQPQTWSSTGGGGRDPVSGSGMGGQEIRSSSSSGSGNRQSWAPLHQPPALPRPQVAGETRGAPRHGEPYHGEPRHGDPHLGEPPHGERVYMRSHPGERARGSSDVPSSWQRSKPQQRQAGVGGGGGGGEGDGGREREDPEPLYPVYKKKRKESSSSSCQKDPAISSSASRGGGPAAAAEEERSGFRRSAVKGDGSARPHASSPTASSASGGGGGDPQAARPRRAHSPCTISWRDGENSSGVSGSSGGHGDAERARHGGRPVDSREKGTAPPGGEQGHSRDEPRGGAPGRYREHYPRHESQFVENGSKAAGGESGGGGGVGERRDGSHPPHPSDQGGPRPGPFRLKRPAQLPLHLRVEHHGQAFFPGDNQVPERVSDQQQQQQRRGSDDSFAPPTRRWDGSPPPPQQQQQQQQQPSDGYGHRRGAKPLRESDEGGGWDEEARERQHRPAKMPRLADSFSRGEMGVGGDGGRDRGYSGDHLLPRGYPKQRQTAQDCHAVVMHHNDWRHGQRNGRDDAMEKAYRAGTKPVGGGNRDGYVTGPLHDHDRPSTLSASSGADTAGRRGDAGGDAVLVPSNGGIFVPSGGHVVFHVEAPRPGMRRVSACNGTPIEGKSFTPPQQ